MLFHVESIGRSNVIARTWHGRVPLAKSDEYLRLMREVAIPDYRKTPGNRGAYAMRRIEGDVAHFTMLTFWDELASIAKFAGPQPEVAKYYDFDKDFLLEFAPIAEHFEIYDK
jgi:hypothetical protein